MASPAASGLRLGPEVHARSAVGDSSRRWNFGNSFVSLAYIETGNHGRTLPLTASERPQLVLALGAELSTKTAKVGDTFAAYPVSDLTSNGRRVAPAGSRVTGTVTGVVSGSSAIGAVPTLALRFDQLDLGDSRSVPAIKSNTARRAR